jgi:hypothetical protein
MKKILFWEKMAKSPEESSLDSLNFYQVDEEESIRDLIRSLEEKSISKRLNFSEINPENSSIKKFIFNIMQSYPLNNSENVEYLIDAYRAALITRSKEEGRFIIGVLQLNDTLILAHCKKDPSLAEIKDKMYSVKTVLHPKNIIRADIVKKDGDLFYFSAFEYSYRFSKSHAKFWGIEPEDVGWESLGLINFIVESESIEFSLQIALDPENIKEMFENNKISPMGKINLGRESGTITKAYLFGRCLSFSAFYDFYVAENQKLMPFRDKFKKIIKSQPELFGMNDWYGHLYEEDTKNLFKIEIEGRKEIIKKDHPLYFLGFFTNVPPRIKPTNELLNKFYNSIFNNNLLRFCHVGELIKGEPVKFGSLEVYNDIKISLSALEFLNNLLNQIEDSSSKKIKLILQSMYCLFALENIDNHHFKQIFSYLNDNLIKKEIEFEFKQEGLLTKEGSVEFKSADKVKSNPTDFSKKVIVPDVKKYFENNKLSRYCILYGVEDNNGIKPNYNFPSDSLAKVENEANKELYHLGIKLIVCTIPYRDGKIISVFILPIKNETTTNSKNKI